MEEPVVVNYEMTIRATQYSIVSRAALYIGYGRLLCAGKTGGLLPLFWDQGIIAEDFMGELKSEEAWFGYADGSFETVLLILDLDAVDKGMIDSLLYHAHRICQKKLCLMITSGDKKREWWEKSAFAHRFRRHPFYYRTIGKDDDNTGSIFIPLEKIPAFENANNKDEMQDVSCDIARVPGLEASSELLVYSQVSDYIRQGDRVLVFPCGYGAGNWILRNTTDAGNIVGYDPDPMAIKYASRYYLSIGSSDMVYKNGGFGEIMKQESGGFDTLISIQNHPEYISETTAREFSRILSPAGRIVFAWPLYSSPDAESQLQYNRKLISQFFFIDQEATIDSQQDATSPPGADLYSGWVIVYAVQNPVVGDRIPYTETAYPNKVQVVNNILSFDRDYDNPWLVKGMVADGFRANNNQVLVRIAGEVLRGSKEGSVDKGAALCVKAYRLLEDAYDDSIEVMLEDINDYIKEIEGLTFTNPHHFRWTISLLYIKAKLLLRLGRIAEAGVTFRRCSDMDVLKYSPLLMTKKVDALYWTGLIYFQQKNTEEAKECWARAIRETEAALRKPWLETIGSYISPLEFSIRELAEIVQTASKCSNALNALRYNKGSSSALWMSQKKDLNTQYKQLQHLTKVWYEPELARLNHSVAEYEKLKADWYEPELARLNHSVAEYEKLKADWYEPELERLNHSVAEYEKLKADWYEPELERLNHSVAEYEKLKTDWYEPELERLRSQLCIPNPRCVKKFVAYSKNKVLSLVTKG